jgi:hypothetical protein
LLGVSDHTRIVLISSETQELLKCYTLSGEHMLRLLWVGPGMGQYWKRWWIPVLSELADQYEFDLEMVRLIDLKGAPNKLPERLASSQEAARANFFDEEDQWDIVLLDFIEAWQLGKQYWDLHQTPYKLILRAWEHKLKELSPFQVWVRHDFAIHSTVQPNLEPKYKKVVETTRNWRDEIIIDIAGDAAFWTTNAVEIITKDWHKGLTVWQRI